MSAVKVRKGQVTNPTSVRTRLGIVDGDVLDVKVQSNCVVLTRKPAIDDDEETPEQRRIIDAQLAEGLEDIRMGRTYGPFDTAEAAIASMKSRTQETRKLTTPHVSAGFRHSPPKMICLPIAA